MSSSLTEPTKSLDGVIGNTPEFESGILSSSLSPVSKMLALAYSVKYHTVNVENRVRVPESTNTIGCSGNILNFLSF